MAELDDIDALFFVQGTVYVNIDMFENVNMIVNKLNQNCTTKE